MYASTNQEFETYLRGAANSIMAGHMRFAHEHNEAVDANGRRLRARIENVQQREDAVNRREAELATREAALLQQQQTRQNESGPLSG
jgi:hypothetical protein